MSDVGNHDAIRFHFDAPDTWRHLPRCVLVRGWAFESGQPALTAVRARIGTTRIVGQVGLHRPDVRAAFPAAPDDRTGFQVAFTAPRGRFRLEIEAQTAAGVWVPLQSLNAHGRWLRRPFVLGADSPAELLAGQLALQPQHPPRPLRHQALPPIRLPAGVRLPRLDVVTPSFNQARWLPAALESTANVAGVRHTVRDGGSSDRSVAILQAHATRLHAWSSEPDDGQTDAILRGFATTTGEPDDLMAWLNADDHYLPGALDFVRGFFASHPEVDVLYGNRVLIDEHGHEIGRWHLPPHDPAVLRLYDFVPQETLFWRRRAWDRVGGLDPTFDFALDWDLLLRFQAAGARLVHVPRFLAAFRLHPAQKSSAQIGHAGQAELDRLRRRTFGRDLSPAELIQSPVLQRYLRHSARLTLLARCGLRPRLST